MTDRIGCHWLESVLERPGVCEQVGPREMQPVRGDDLKSMAGRRTLTTKPWSWPFLVASILVMLVVAGYTGRSVAEMGDASELPGRSVLQHQVDGTWKPSRKNVA